MLFRSIRAGLGFAFVPKTLAEAEHLPWSAKLEGIRSDIYAIWRCTHASPVLQAFIDLSTYNPTPDHPASSL